MANYKGVTVPAGTDLADGPKAFRDAVDGGGFIGQFDTAAARTAAIPTPVEGMLSYLRNSNRYETFNGTAWVSLATVLVGVAAPAPGDGQEGDLFVVVPA